MRLRHAASALLMTAALTGCGEAGTDDVPRAEVEQQVLQRLQGEGYKHVQKVSCDDDLPAKEKAAVECDVDVEGQPQVRVRLTVSDVSSSGEVRYDIEDAG